MCGCVKKRCDGAYCRFYSLAVFFWCPSSHFFCEVVQSSSFHPLPSLSFLPSWQCLSRCCTQREEVWHLLFPSPSISRRRKNKEKKKEKQEGEEETPAVSQQERVVLLLVASLSPSPYTLTCQASQLFAPLTTQTIMMAQASTVADGTVLSTAMSFPPFFRG